MNLITTTELRTKTKSFVESLLNGEEIKLVHRSKIIGTFRPETVEAPKIFDADKFKKIVKKLNFPHFTDKQIDERYRKAMIEKHGKSIL